MRRFLVILACLGLCACFQSERSLIGEADAIYPLGEGARLEPVDPKSADEPETFTRSGVGYKGLAVSGASLVAFAPLDPNDRDGRGLLIFAIVGEHGESLFEVARIRDGVLEMASPSCTDLSNADAARLKVTRKDAVTCTVTSLAQMRGVVAALHADLEFDQRFRIQKGSASPEKR